MTIAVQTINMVRGLNAYHHTHDGVEGFIVGTGGQQQFVVKVEAERLGRYLLDLPDPTTSDLLGVAIRGIDPEGEHA
jgi:hypothetical protein